MKTPRVAWMTVIIVNLLGWCVLGFWQSTSVAQQTGRQPFANSVEQRGEMIELLRELNTQLREQNELLRSGRLQVIVNDEP